MRIFKWLGGLLLALIVGAAAWFYVSPPDLIRVGAGYAAKIVCSNVFLAGRDPGEVLEVDVQAPGNPLLRLLRVSVDRDAGTVRAGLLGVFGKGLALYREGAGCASVPDGDLAAVRALPAPAADAGEPAPDAPWPAGSVVTPIVDEALDAALNDPGLAGPGMRAIVVVKGGRIVAERYGDGFDADTRLLGWSMTKTVNAALVGTVIRDGRLSLDRADLFDTWTDGRSKIALADMMGMASGLQWNEGYGDVSDVTRMLYLEPDMAGFASALPLDPATPDGIGKVFNYSSGTAVMLSRLWRNALGDRAETLGWPRKALFDPLGMRSAVLETDARDTFVGSSYLYATARDWARFGQFLLQRGVWNGRSLLPVGFVDWMVAPHPASRGVYGKGQLWLSPPNAEAPGDSPALPDDAFFLEGHDGQSVSVVPSQDLVVVRLGLTPSREGYKVARLVDGVIQALREAP